jgi:S1-C subfamily serine protease
MRPLLLLLTGSLLALPHRVPAQAPADVTAPTGPVAGSFGTVADKVLPGVVSILSPSVRGGGGQLAPAIGCGVIVSADGYILTMRQAFGNTRVVDVLVRQNGSSREVPAQVVHVDPATNAALLKIDLPGLSPVTLGSAARLRPGDAVFAVTASERHRRVQQGSFLGMARERSRARGRGEEFLESDLIMSRTEAGGAIVDSEGRLVGLTMVAAMAGGTGLIMPIDPLMPALNSMTMTSPVAAGPRGFLGINAQDVPPAPAPPGVPPPPRGVEVIMVGAGSPAEAAGIQVGDVIMAINGQPTEDRSLLRQALAGLPPGTGLAIDLLRAGQPMSVRAILAELPPEAAAADPSLPGGVPTPAMPSTPPASTPPSAPAEILPGLTAAALTPDVRASHALPAEVTGVLVTRVDPGSRAESMGVEQGDVITQVNRKPVAGVEEARQFAATGETTVLLKVYRKGDTMLFMVGR